VVAAVIQRPVIGFPADVRAITRAPFIPTNLGKSMASIAEDEWW